MADDYSESPSTLGRVSIGGSVTGSIETADDGDWFAVRLTAGQSYDFRLTAIGSNGLTDPLLGLFDGVGNLVDFNDDGPSGVDSQLVFTAATSGTYYLGAYGYSSFDLGDYRLSAAVATLRDDYGADTGTTGTVSVGSTGRGGSIDFAGDVDWVKITLRAGVHHPVELNAEGTTFNPLGDPLFVGIHDSAGRRLPGTTNDDYGIGLNSHVIFTPAASGTYYLAAGSYGSGTGSYTIGLGVGTTDTTAPRLLAAAPAPTSSC